jgi:type I restriction enzyme S subunit
MTPVKIRRLATPSVVKDQPGERPNISLEHVVGGTARLVPGEIPVTGAGDSLAFEPGDVLFSKLRPYLAKSLLVTEPLFGSSEFLAIQSDPNSLDPRYLVYVTLSRPWLDWAMATSYGTKMPRTSWEQMAEFVLHLPTLDEQRRFADFLDEQVARIDRTIELREQERQLLREQRDALIKTIVSGASHGGRIPADLLWLDELPRHWTTPKITYAARLGSGHTPSRSRPEWWVDCDIPWITTGEVAALRDDNIETITETRERLSRLGIENSSAEIHPAGTVVLSRTASAGYSGVMATDMCTSQDFVTWTCSPRLNPYWLLWCLRAMRSDLLGRLAMGSTFKTIYVPDIQTLRIPLPPLEEQHEAVADIRGAVDVAKRRAELIDRGIALLQERKQALITAAVTGDLDVTTARTVA